MQAKTVKVRNTNGILQFQHGRLFSNNYRQLAQGIGRKRKDDVSLETEGVNFGIISGGKNFPRL